MLSIIQMKEILALTIYADDIDRDQPIQHMDRYSIIKTPEMHFLFSSQVEELNQKKQYHMDTFQSDPDVAWVYAFMKNKFGAILILAPIA